MDLVFILLLLLAVVTGLHIYVVAIFPNRAKMRLKETEEVRRLRKELVHLNLRALRSCRPWQGDPEAKSKTPINPGYSVLAICLHCGTGHGCNNLTTCVRCGAAYWAIRQVVNADGNWLPKLEVKMNDKGQVEKIIT